MTDTNTDKTDSIKRIVQEWMNLPISNQLIIYHNLTKHINEKQTSGLVQVLKSNGNIKIHKPTSDFIRLTLGDTISWNSAGNIIITIGKMLESSCLSFDVSCIYTTKSNKITIQITITPIPSFLLFLAEDLDTDTITAEELLECLSTD